MTRHLEPVDSHLKSAQQEIERCKRHGGTLCLLMLEIYHFKTVIDTFGHAVSDRAQQAVAQACGKELYSSDLLGRIGGEEFALLLVETDMEKSLLSRQKAARAVGRK
jgi:diguanylate cyclase (GGDEF)-like protein